MRKPEAALSAGSACSASRRSDVRPAWYWSRHSGRDAPAPRRSRRSTRCPRASQCAALVSMYALSALPARPWISTTSGRTADPGPGSCRCPTRRSPLRSPISKGVAPRCSVKGRGRGGGWRCERSEGQAQTMGRADGTAQKSRSSASSPWRLSEPRLPGRRGRDERREQLVALRARVHAVVGRDVRTPRGQAAEGLEDLDERNAEFFAQDGKSAREGAKAQRLLRLAEVRRSHKERAPGLRLFENRPRVPERFLEYNPRAASVRGRVVGPEGENDAAIHLGRKPTQDLVTPAATDVLARVAAHAEVVVGDAAPHPRGPSAHAPGPTEAFGIAGSLHQGVPHKADAQVASRWLDPCGALRGECHRNWGVRFSVNAAIASL